MNEGDLIVFGVGDNVETTTCFLGGDERGDIPVAKNTRGTILESLEHGFYVVRFMSLPDRTDVTCFGQEICLVRESEPNIKTTPDDAEDGTEPVRTLAMGQHPLSDDDTPDEKFIRGRCPECGDYLVSAMYREEGRGLFMVWECWASLKPDATCHYFHVL